MKHKMLLLYCKQENSSFKESLLRLSIRRIFLRSQPLNPQSSQRRLTKPLIKPLLPKMPLNITPPIRPIRQLTRRRSQHQILLIQLKRIPTHPEIMPDGKAQRPSIVGDLLAVDLILGITTSTEFYSVAET